MNQSDVLIALRKTMQGQSLRKFGAVTGLSAAYLSDVLRGNREPGPAILNILDMEKVTDVSYRTKLSKNGRKSK